MVKHKDTREYSMLYIQVVPEVTMSMKQVSYNI